jgi:hypothetical protein
MSMSTFLFTFLLKNLLSYPNRYFSEVHEEEGAMY